MATVKRISEWYVRPEIEVEDSKRQYNLNSSDLSMLLLGYSQCIHLFKKPQTYDFNSSSFLPKFISSLSKALVHFYPFAGQLVTETHISKDDHSCFIYIDCHKGLGAKVILAEAVDVFIDDVLPFNFNSDIPNIIQSLFETDIKELINYDGETKPLLSIQVTELVDGVVIGICTNHCVADGISAINFCKIWSDIFMEKSSSISSVPIVGVQGTMIKLPYTDPRKFAIRVSTATPTRERIFHFSPTSLALLKAKANAEAAVPVSGNNINMMMISSFQALAAFTWRCITRARSLSSNARTTCGLVANVRARYDPPLPKDYFGNFLKPARESAEVGELLDNNLGWAALLLHRAVRNLNNDTTTYTCGQTESVTQLFLPGLGSYGTNPVLFGGSPRLDAYTAEFGLGRPVVVHMGFREKDGYVSAFPGAKGDGSVDLQLCLAPQPMSLLMSDEEFMTFVSSSVS